MQSCVVGASRIKFPSGLKEIQAWESLLKRRAKDYSNPGQFLWTDLPAAHDTLAAGTKAWRRKWRTKDTALLSHFIDEGYAISESAVASADVDQFLADLDAALSNPAVQIPMTFWDDE